MPMRPASLAFLRGGGKVLGGKPRIMVEPDGRARVIDGRHRITIARERGQKTITAQVIGLGRRGGERWRVTTKVKI